MPAPTLDVFLLARLDEDEQTARDAAEEVGDGHWQQRNVRVVTVADRDREIADYAIVECIDHIVRHDPARVLREVEAKRRIIELHDQGGQRWVGFPRADRQENYCVHDQLTAPCPTVRLLALPYVDHPDYREEWKP